MDSNFFMRVSATEFIIFIKTCIKIIVFHKLTDSRLQRAELLKKKINSKKISSKDKIEKKKNFL